MTLPPPGGWTRRGPRQIMRPSSLFTSPADAFKGCAYGSRRNVSIASSKAGRGRTAPDERVKSGFGDAVGISFAFVISCQRCASRCMACARSLSRFFTEDDMAKKAKKAKKTAKAATKKVAKKTSKKKK